MHISFITVFRAKNLAALDFRSQIDNAIKERSFDPYQDFLGTLNLASVFEYQLQLVVSTYPGWRVLFYHDVAYALTRSEPPEENPDLHRVPVPLLPRAIAELGGRYYQADLHPETEIGDANFLEHPTPWCDNWTNRYYRFWVCSLPLYTRWIKCKSKATPSSHRGLCGDRHRYKPSRSSPNC